MEFFFVGHQDPSLSKWGSPKEQETPLAMGDYVVVCLPDTLAELRTKKSMRPRMYRTLHLFSFKIGGLKTFPWSELNKKMVSETTQGPGSIFLKKGLFCN